MKSAKPGVPGRRPVDHEGIVTAQVSRAMRLYFSPEARDRFEHFVVSLRAELKASEKPEHRKAG